MAVSSSAADATPAQRFDGLDVVRAAAMFLGIVYHATYAYVPDIGHWYVVHDAASDERFKVLALTLHSFRMEVFFALSGFFAHLVMEKRGVVDFLGERFRRLLVPLLVAAPLGIALDRLERELSARQGSLDPTYFAGTGWLLRPLHLWFLEYLFLFALLVWGLSAVGVRGEGAQRAFTRALKWPEVFIALAGLTFAAAQWLPEPTPGYSFAPTLETAARFLPFFGFGWLLFGARGEVESLRRRGAWLVVPGLVIAAAVASSDVQWRAEGRLLSAVGTWLVVMGSFGLAFRLPTRRRPWLRAVVEASYWVYLVHHPLVVLLQVALVGFGVGAWVKFAAVVGVTTLVALASFWVVKPVVGRWLGGRRQGDMTS